MPLRRLSRYFPPLLLCAAAFLLVPARSARIRPGLVLSEQKLKNFEVEPGDVGKLFSAPGADAAVQNSLPESAAGSFHAVQEHFRLIDQYVRETRTSKTTLSRAVLAPAKCLPSKMWAELGAYYANLRGLAGNDASCQQVLKHWELPPANMSELPPRRPMYEGLVPLHRALDALAPRAARAGAGRWGLAFHVGAVLPESEQCALRRQMALRVGGDWFLQTVLTNRPLNGSAPDREYLEEHVRHARGAGFESVGMFLHARNAPEASPRPVAATALYRQGGRVPQSAFQVPKAADNPALRRVRDILANEVEQARDTIQASNLAILALPLVMNVVPVALMADVNTLGMFLYTVMTDVLTAIPLFIKGIELLMISKAEETAAATYYSGSSDAAKELAVAELFVAHCNVSQELVPTGIVLIVVAFVLMMFGVALEFIAKHWVMKKRKRLQAAAHPFAAAALTLQQQNRSSPLPVDGPCACMCHARRRRHVDSGGAAYSPVPLEQTRHRESEVPHSAGPHLGVTELRKNW